MPALTVSQDGQEAAAKAADFLVSIVDSHRGPYLETTDIEQEVLQPYARPVLHRVHVPEELLGHIEEADVIISWHTIPLQADLLRRLRQCRGIVRAAVGFDNIDIGCAGTLGIPVCVVPDYGTEEVADHTIALLLALVRNLRELDQHARSGGWDWRTIGRVPRLRGATLGIVGFGRIGRSVARRAQAFGLQVAFYDPYAPSGTEKVYGVTRYDTLDDLLEHARMLSLHVPLTDETHHLMGRRELERLSPDVILINTSRGEVIDQEALIAQVLAGRIGRVGLDVLAHEPHVPEAFRTSERVLLTAHSAFYADASLVELRYKAATVARRLLLGQPVRDIVNGVAVGPHTQAS